MHLVNTNGIWRQAFSGSGISLGYVRSGAFWPAPDAVLIDAANSQQKLCTLEFEPPQSSKTECMRGLGQATTYLADFDCAALILPDRADDGYDIANHISSLLSTLGTEQARIGVYAYPVATTNPTSNTPVQLQLLKPIGGMSPNPIMSQRVSLEETFWAFWRDSSSLTR